MPKNSLPEKKIVIDAYPIASPYEGLGVFCKQIGERLGMRAAVSAFPVAFLSDTCGSVPYSLPVQPHQKPLLRQKAAHDRP